MLHRDIFTSDSLWGKSGCLYIDLGKKREFLVFPLSGGEDTWCAVLYGMEKQQIFCRNHSGVNPLWLKVRYLVLNLKSTNIDFWMLFLPPGCKSGKTLSGPGSKHSRVCGQTSARMLQPWGEPSDPAWLMWAGSSPAPSSQALQPFLQVRGHYQSSCLFGFVHPDPWVSWIGSTSLKGLL